MAEKMNPSNSENRRSENLRILVVDDDKIICQLHLNQMKKAGINHEFLVLHNGEEAFEFLDGNPEKSDILILLDLNMPVMNGWDFLDRLQERKYENKIFVIVITSSTAKEDLFRAMAYQQVINFFEKPLYFEDVMALKESEQIRQYFENGDSDQ